MNTAFRQYVFSGLSFRAYAARFQISIPTLLRAITGLTEAPPELDHHEVSRTLIPTDTASLYIGMQGPRGSLRWHQWQVEREIADAIMGNEEAYQEACSDPGRLFLFSTVDNLVVAINPQHIVTAMFGHEETRFIEQKALVSSQLVSGDGYLPHNETAVLQRVHDTLKQAVEQSPTEEALDDVALAECPGYIDKRPSMAFLRELKTPFQDRLWISGIADRVLANNQTLCTQLATAIHIDDRLNLPVTVAIIDSEGMPTQILLPREQTSVLQVPRWTIERTALEMRRTSGTDAEMGNTVEAIRSDCLALGLFGSAEIEEYLAGFQHLSEPSQKPLAKPKAKRKSVRSTQATIDEIFDS